MTAFLVATLMALLVCGALVVVWREHPERFRPALAGAAALFVLAGSYAWWVTHGHEVVGDEDIVALSGLRVQEVAGSYRVTGNIRNASRDRAVSAVPLVLQVEQCTEAACTLLHETALTLAISIPPGEGRPFTAVFNTPRVPRDLQLQFRVDHEGPRTYEASSR